MAKVISIVNNKGGVGKTTTCGIISQLLAYLGKKVLCIDLDPQSNMSMMLDCYEREADEVIRGTMPPTTKNIADIFKDRIRTAEEVHKIIRKTKIRNLDIIPANKRHENTVQMLMLNQVGNNNIILKKATECINEEYDYIILDNAPAKDILTVNSLFISDLVFVPVRLEDFSKEGLREIIALILYIKEEHDLKVEFGGAFLTQGELNTKALKEAQEEYREELGSKFMETVIRKDIKVSDIEKEFRPILQYCPNTNAVFDYARLILEMKILDKQSEKMLKESIGAE